MSDLQAAREPADEECNCLQNRCDNNPHWPSCPQFSKPISNSLTPEEVERAVELWSAFAAWSQQPIDTEILRKLEQMK